MFCPWNRKNISKIGTIWQFPLVVLSNKSIRSDNQKLIGLLFVLRTVKTKPESCPLGNFRSVWLMRSWAVCLDILFSKSALLHQRPISDWRLRISLDQHRWRPSSERRRSRRIDISITSTSHLSIDQLRIVDSQSFIGGRPAIGSGLRSTISSSIVDDILVINQQASDRRCPHRAAFSHLFHCSARIDDILVGRAALHLLSARIDGILFIGRWVW